MKRTTVKINLNTLDVWFKKAVKQILADISDPKVGLRQDYFTATDLEACIRLTADERAGEAHQAAEDAKWWGYNGWCRIDIVDKPSRYTLLDLCRQYLADQVHDGKLEAHNFGRGHCSGMRFRKKGSGINEAEEQTMKNKQKVKPVHAKELGDKPSFQKKILCQANRPRKLGWQRQSRSFTRSTDDHSKVTCKRCLRLLADQKHAEATRQLQAENRPFTARF